MEVISRSTEDTKRLAESLAAGLKNNSVIALYGELGSGKTTFTTYLVKALGLDVRVQSPTFVIVRKYSNEGKIGIVNHIDLYRLTSKEEVDEIGIAELIKDFNTITIIEWPEMAEHLLPEGTIKLKFETVDENTRRIYVQD